MEYRSFLIKGGGLALLLYWSIALNGEFERANQIRENYLNRQDVLNEQVIAEADDFALRNRRGYPEMVSGIGLILGACMLFEKRKTIAP